MGKKKENDSISKIQEETTQFIGRFAGIRAALQDASKIERRLEEKLDKILKAYRYFNRLSPPTYNGIEENMVEDCLKELKQQANVITGFLGRNNAITEGE